MVTNPSVMLFRHYADAAFSLTSLMVGYYSYYIILIFSKSLNVNVINPVTIQNCGLLPAVVQNKLCVKHLSRYVYSVGAFTA